MTSPDASLKAEVSTKEFTVAAELDFLRACFDSLVYVAPEAIPRIQAQIAGSLSKLAACALLENASKFTRLSPLSDIEVTAIAAGFTGSLSQLVRDAASAQRIKADFQLSKAG